MEKSLNPGSALGGNQHQRPCRCSRAPAAWIDTTWSATEVTSINGSISVASRSRNERERMKALAKPAILRDSGVGNLDNPEVDGSFNGPGEHLLATDSGVVSALTSSALSAAGRF